MTRGDAGGVWCTTTSSYRCPQLHALLLSLTIRTRKILLHLRYLSIAQIIFQRSEQFPKCGSLSQTGNARQRERSSASLVTRHVDLAGWVVRFPRPVWLSEALYRRAGNGSDYVRDYPLVHALV